MTRVLDPESVMSPREAWAPILGVQRIPVGLHLLSWPAVTKGAKKPPGSPSTWRRRASRSVQRQPRPPPTRCCRASRSEQRQPGPPPGKHEKKNDQNKRVKQQTSKIRLSKRGGRKHLVQEAPAMATRGKYRRESSEAEHGLLHAH